MSWKLVRRLTLYSALFVTYLVSTVPVGLFIYSIKTEVAFDIFPDGGLHAYMQCLSTSFPVAKRKLAAVAPADEPQQRCEATKPQADVVPPSPAPVPATTFEDAKRLNEKRGREGTREQCMLEATRLGKAAALWCAGL
jgi:hypothetical protein